MIKKTSKFMTDRYILNDSFIIVAIIDNTS